MEDCSALLITYIPQFSTSHALLEISSTVHQFSLLLISPIYTDIATESLYTSLWQNTLEVISI